MPELPEVETTLRGIEPYLLHQTIRQIEVRDSRLRWPIPDSIRKAGGQLVQQLRRRAKYIIAGLDDGAFMIHLGMSGSLRVLEEPLPPGKHDHFDIITDEAIIRYHDPRRFGSLLWLDDGTDDHQLLRHLGPEPLSTEFSGALLHERSRGRRQAVKNFIMDGRIVVGVGNIYASEALFMAGIHPNRAAGRISRNRYQGLAEAIVEVLKQAIRQGGTTLRDYASTDGQPGYFAQNLLTYGRAGQACFQCGSAIRQKVIGQRSSFYCVRCQH